MHLATEKDKLRAANYRFNPFEIERCHLNPQFSVIIKSSKKLFNLLKWLGYFRREKKEFLGFRTSIMLPKTEDKNDILFSATE